MAIKKINYFTIKNSHFILANQVDLIMYPTAIFNNTNTSLIKNLINLMALN